MQKKFLLLIVLFFIAGCVDDKSLLVNVTKRSNQATTDLRETLKDGGDVNIQDEKGNTPLMKALSSGNMVAVQMILRYGKNLNVSMTNKKGETALLKVSEFILADEGNDHSEIVKDLLQRGAKPTKRIFSNIKVGLFRQIAWQKSYWHDDIYYKLFVNKYKMKDEILLFEYVRAGKVAQVKKELKKGISINYSDQHGNSALVIACKNNDYKIVRFLGEKGAKINVRNDVGQSPLGLAFSKKNEKMALLLIRNGWPDIDSNDGPKLLKKAIENDLLKVVKLLLDKDISYNKKQLIFYPVINNKKALFDLLLSRSTVGSKDSSGKLPLNYALDNKNRYHGRENIDQALLPGKKSSP